MKLWNILHTALPVKSGTSSWNLEMSVPGTVFWITLDYSCNINVVSEAVGDGWGCMCTVA